MPDACNFIEKETLAHVFPCEICKIFKNKFFTEHLPEAAHVFPKLSESYQSDAFNI